MNLSSTVDIATMTMICTGVMSRSAGLSKPTKTARRRSAKAARVSWTSWDQPKTGRDGALT